MLNYTEENHGEMSDFKKVTHNCVLHWLLIKWFTFWQRFVHFRQVEVLGARNLRYNGAKIINPNHPNSFVDDISVLTTNRLKTVIVGHAGLFKNKLVTRFLIFFRLLPAFRREDGFNNICKNHGSFEHAIYAMEKGFSLLIFPEAQQTGLNSLIRIRKGAIRIAFLYAEKYNFQRPVYLVPTAIYYTDFYQPRGKLLVRYGEPINVLDYKEIYDKLPSRAIARVRDELESRMKQQMLHIEKGRFYEAINFSRDLFDVFVSAELGVSLKDVKNKFFVDKFIVERIAWLGEVDHERYNSLMTAIEEYRNGLLSNGTTDDLVERDIKLWKLTVRTLFMLIYLPVYLVLLVNFSVPYFLSEFITGFFSDRQDKASVRFVAPMVFVPLWVAYEIYVLWNKVNVLLIKVLYVVFWPLLYGLFLDSTKLLGQTYNMWKLYLRKPDYIRLKKVRKLLIDRFSELMEEDGVEKIFVDY